MPKSKKDNLFGKSLKDLEQIVLSLGEKPFRAKQLFNWLYDNRIKAVRDAKNLPKELLEKLNENYTIVHPKIVEVLEDEEDGTKKYLLELEDGELVESVLMKYDYGNSACLSTQVGCAMGCSFCASGKNGKVRDLSSEEIAGQIVAMENESGERISNIVLMGMGEPLDNYENVLNFIRFTNEVLGIGQRHITLSTSGIVPKIYDLAKEDLQINLAISLHSAFQDKREKLMKVAKTNPLNELIKAGEDYFDQTGRRVTYEYTVIEGVNDTEADVSELKKLFKGKVHHLNLIPLNPVSNLKRESSKKNVNIFQERLKKEGLTSTIRKKNGANIEAACGQLRNRKLQSPST